LAFLFNKLLLYQKGVEQKCKPLK